MIVLIGFCNILSGSPISFLLVHKKGCNLGSSVAHNHVVWWHWSKPPFKSKHSHEINYQLWIRNCYFALGRCSRHGICSRDYWQRIDRRYIELLGPRLGFRTCHLSETKRSTDCPLRRHWQRILECWSWSPSKLRHLLFGTGKTNIFP